MKITITNITKRLQVTLLSSNEYVRATGCHPNTHHYIDTSASTGYVWLQSWTGLQSGAASVSNTTLKAINTNGSYFAGNSWGPTTFSIKFKPLLDETFQRLNECIKYKNEPLYIEVETDKKYYMWCIVDDGSSIEFGELTFLSALDGTGTYWSTGDASYKWQIGSGSGLVQSGAQSKLGDYVNISGNTITFSHSTYITGEQYPIITIKMPRLSFELLHVNSGVSYKEYDAGYMGPQTYVFDSRTQTTKYNGSTVNYIEQYITFSGGEELLQLKCNKDIDMSELEDIEITVTYENLYSTVYGG